MHKFARDITERMRTEQKVLESEQLFRIMVGAAFDGIYIGKYEAATDKIHIIFCNDKCVEMSGYTREQLLQTENLGDLFINHNSPEQQARGRECIVNCTPFMGLGSWKRPDDKENFFEWSAVSVRQNNQLHLIAINRDITERKKTEEQIKAANQQLLESQREFRLFVETAFDGVCIGEYVSDRSKWHLIFCSDKFVEMSGYTREQLMNEEDMDSLYINYHSAEERAQGRECIANGTPYTGLISWKRPDGKDNFCEWSAAAVEKDGKFHTMSIYRDITDRKQAEKEIRQYQNDLQSLAVDLSLAEDRERRRLASSLHDNAGQLLSLAKIKLSTLDTRALSAESKESLAEIEELVTQAEQSARSLTFEIYNPALHDLGFEPAVEWLGNNIQELYGLKVELADDGQHKPMDEPLRVVMFRCLREVLINVAKHAKVERARVGIARKGEFVRVTVKDEGLGFDPQSVLVGSRGFGLFSIRERVTRLGGHVEIKSSPGQGTTVILEGPISTNKHKTTGNKP